MSFEDKQLQCSDCGAEFTFSAEEAYRIRKGKIAEKIRDVVLTGNVFKTLEAIETRTRKAGGEVVGLLGFGSAFVSPAWAALEMAEAIIFDKRKIIPVCAKLEGEYGVNGLFVGVPAILGKNGMEQVIELDLTDAEKEAFAHSVEAVSKTCGEVDEMFPVTAV